MNIQDSTVLKNLIDKKNQTQRSNAGKLRNLTN